MGTIELSHIWTAAAVLLGFQITAFTWRITREMAMEAEGERTWVTLADGLVGLSFLLLVSFVFAAPVKGLFSAERAAEWFGAALFVFAAYPFVLVGHYNLYCSWGRGDSRPQVTNQEWAAAGVASIFVLGATMWLFDLSIYLPKGGWHLWAESLFYVTSSVILTATAIAAAWRFRIFRMNEAAIKIDLDITSRRSSPTYNALSAVAIVTNTSRVVTRFTGVQWEVRVLSPYTDEAVEGKTVEYQGYYSVSEDPVEFPWNVNYALSQENARIYLEPGESNTVSMSLAIPNWIEAVDVRLVLSAPPSRKNRQDDAWVARRTHDLPVEVTNGNQTSNPEAFGQ